MVVELAKNVFQCLALSYDSGIVNYDNRARNLKIQTETLFAINQIETILENIQKPNKSLILQPSDYDETTTLDTNYYRELQYNLEHCIHHQAIMKIGMLLNFDYPLEQNFGVAFSTINFRAKST